MLAIDVQSVLQGKNQALFLMFASNGIVHFVHAVDVEYVVQQDDDDDDDDSHSHDGDGDGDGDGDVFGSLGLSQNAIIGIAVSSGVAGIAVMVAWVAVVVLCCVLRGRNSTIVHVVDRKKTE